MENQSPALCQKSETELSTDPYFWQVVELKYDLNNKRAENASLRRSLFWASWAVVGLLCLSIYLLAEGFR